MGQRRSTAARAGNVTPLNKSLTKKRCLPFLMIASMLLIITTTKAQLPPSMLEMHLQSDLGDPLAVCNDGSPAKYYVRGCPRPAKECADAGPPRWIVVFEDGGVADSCWDKETCTSVEGRRTSSMGLNATLSPNGIFATSGEANPNFYMHHAVFVPACTSDMWLGNASSSSSIQFRGRAVINAVMRKVARLAANASALTIAGGAGVMSLIDGFLPTLPSQLHNAPRAVCDGCLIMDVAPHKQPAGCSKVAECPPKMALARGFAAWGLSSDWHGLLADRLVASVKTPMLVQHPQFDSIQLGMLGAWPAIFLPARRIYAERFGAGVRSLLQARQGGLFSFSAACSTAVENTLVARDAFACRPVQCMVGTPGNPPTNTTDSLMAVMGMFLRDQGMFQPACIDHPGAGIDGGAYCAAPRCY